MKSDETIVALATPNGVGALAIIRISGKKTVSIVEKTVKEKEKFQKQRERTIGLFTIIKKEKVIDHVTIIKYKKPQSYTGEDLIEIITHGGVFTVKNIIKQLLNNGARIAQRGEFSKRAFLNGKIDLIKAESIKSIIESSTEEKYEKAILSYFNQGKKIREWKEKIENEITFIEAEIEFGEEDEVECRNENCIKELQEELQEEIKREKAIEKNNEGIKIVIAGPSNAGKSSLFNYLLGTDRAIVNKKKGTTRDIISEKIVIGEKDIKLIDTAGVRKTDCEIEKEGITKTKSVLQESTLIIWITDSNEKIEESEKKTLIEINDKEKIILFNKCEKGKNVEKENYYKNIKGVKTTISVEKKINLDSVIKKIEKIIKNKNDLSEILINERQIQIAEKCNECIINAIANWKQKEIASYYLKQSLESFNEIFGTTNNEEIINKIFNEFCIGK